MLDIRISRTMLRHAVLAILAAIGVASVTPAAARNDDAASALQREDRSTALVQLNGDPLSTYTRTRPAPGR